jgi:hypothetical protein
MSNLKLLKFINPIMVVAFLTVATCAIIMALRIPLPDSISNNILPTHMLAGKVFIFLALCHIILNWNWIKLHIFGIKAKPKSKKK